MAIHFRMKKNEQKWSNKRTLEYYLMIECFIPRKDKEYMKKLKRDQEEKGIH